MTSNSFTRRDRRWRPHRQAMLIATLACGAALGGIGGGCNWFGGGKDRAGGAARTGPTTTSRPASTMQTFQYDQPVPLALQPTNRPIVQGPLPLIYLVEADCELRVVNLTTSEEIISFPAKATEIIRVETRGVLRANRPVLGASLTQGTYAIELVTDGGGAGNVRATQTRTQPAAPKPTAPQQQQPPAAPGAPQSSQPPSAPQPPPPQPPPPQPPQPQPR